VLPPKRESKAEKTKRDLRAKKAKEFRERLAKKPPATFEQWGQYQGHADPLEKWVLAALAWASSRVVELDTLVTLKKLQDFLSNEVAC
jgi:hypothetical protein